MTGGAAQVVEDAIAARVFPAAVAEVGDADGVLWTVAAGRLTFVEDAPEATAGTIFDLASLTKPLATAAVAMALVDEGRVRLDDPVTEHFAEWRGDSRESVTIADLLEHASGLPARFIDPPPEDRREFEHDICTIELEYAPRTRSLYSDLGFMLLGFALESIGGTTLDRLFDELCQRTGVEGLGFINEGRPHRAGPATGHVETGARPADVGAGLRGGEGPGRIHASAAASTNAAIFAPTMPLAEDRRRRRLAGEVHDNYAHALGGVAGHAGLFGTAASVGAAARVWLAAARGDRRVGAPFTPALVERFTRRTLVAGSSRALGWDTMLPTSSCGVRMTADAFGHVGYTGTSLWIDPPRDRYFVLLTNRACGGGTLEEMREVRRAFHDAWP